ncbi:MAG TPA: hypothetical protein VGM51_06915 [Armatimonadota bacterium]|jgi:hypothetical protein
MRFFRTRPSRSAALLLHAAVIASLLVVLVAGTAYAGKGGKGSTTGSTGGLTVVMVTDQNGNGAPNWADWVTFTFTATATNPQVNLQCSQGGTLVYSSSHLMYWPNFWDDNGVFWLESGAWSGGAASCTAVLKGTSSRGTLLTLGSLSFSVAA